MNGVRNVYRGLGLLPAFGDVLAISLRIIRHNFTIGNHCCLHGGVIRRCLCITFRRAAARALRL
jgi:hypothetical protein